MIGQPREPSTSDRGFVVLDPAGELYRTTSQCSLAPSGAALLNFTWLHAPGVPPGKRNAGIEAARISDDIWEPYRDRWADLDQPTETLPVRLPPWMRTMMRTPRVELPPGHHGETRRACPRGLAV